MSFSSYLCCFLFFRRASRRERLPLFLFLLFSLLLVLACGFSLVRFLTNSFRSVRETTGPTVFLIHFLNI
uniref:Uncharacterized protein n=1 Tax=Amphilophus citrinellus TaxID=61819 RepID=A0A3Q0SYZ4_AMPCI